MAMALAGLHLLLSQPEMSLWDGWTWSRGLLVLGLIALFIGWLRSWVAVIVAALWLWEVDWSRNLDLELGPLTLILIWSVLVMSPSGEPLSLLALNKKLSRKESDSNGNSASWKMPQVTYHWLAALFMLVVFLNGLLQNPWLPQSLEEAIGHFLRLPQEGVSLIYLLAPLFWLFKSTRGLAWLMLFGLIVAYTFMGVSEGTGPLLLAFLLFFLDGRWLGAKASVSPPILFFDGLCGLCNRSVDWALSEDRDKRLLFAPLQGEKAAKLLPQELRQDLNTLVLWVDGELSMRSTAVLKLAEHLGGVWRLAVIFKLIPRPLRDSVYNLVAQNRYRWFGQRQTCRLPTAEEKGRILP